MKEDKNISSRIEEFLNGSLSETERNAFEAELAGDASLKEQVELTSLANKLVQRNKLWEIKDLINEIDTEQKSLRQKRQWGLVGIGLIIVASSAFYFIVSEKETAGKVALPKVQQIEQAKEVTVSVKPAKEEVVAEPSTNRISIKKTALQEKAIVANTEPITVATQSVNETILGPKAQDLVVNNSMAPSGQSAQNTIEMACSSTKIDAYVGTENACVNASNGRITVSGLRGGQQPYRYKILDEAKVEHSATGLQAGTYSVIITDGKACVRIIDGVTVKEENCEKDFEINAANGEIWELGAVPNTTSLTVYDKGENMYFYKQFAAGEKIQWNGVSTKGDISAGYFLFVIKYQDGKSRAGSFTISK